MTFTPDITFATNAAVIETYWTALLVVFLTVMTVGLLAAIVIDFRSASGKKTRSGLIVLVAFMLGGILGVATGMGVVHGLRERHVAETCAVFEEMYQSQFEDCGDLDIPLYEPQADVMETFGSTEAVFEYDGEELRIGVTLVWDGRALLLAESETFHDYDDGHDHDH